MPTAFYLIYVRFALKQKNQKFKAFTKIAKFYVSFCQDIKLALVVVFHEIILLLQELDFIICFGSHTYIFNVSSFLEFHTIFVKAA